ncbi:MAG: hypothetical protein ISS23_02715 [Nanoarchaeota archaeon]|nr:hypothetical protein [Nanoarchaeota archaeon]
MKTRLRKSIQKLFPCKEESYLEHAQKVLKDSVDKKTAKELIEDFYMLNRRRLSEKILKEYPLRYFTHDIQIGKGVQIPDPDYERVLINKVDDYIHRYRTNINKNTTLEEAIKKITG